MYRILKTYLRPHFRYVAATVFLVVVEYVLQIFFLLPQSKIIIDRGVLANDYGVIRNSALLMLAKIPPLWHGASVWGELGFLASILMLVVLAIDILRVDK